MTPISYLDYMARLFGLPAQVRKPRLASLIRAVDLLEASGQRIGGFSNGMTARLAVATSLINEPDLLIWDEPTHGLDPEARAQHAQPDQVAQPRKDAGRLLAQPQRHRRGLQSCRRPEPRSADFLWLTAGPQGPHAPQPL